MTAMLHWGMAIAVLSAAFPATLGAGAACPHGAFLVVESGKLAAVEWIEYSPAKVHTRTVLTQSRVVDATIFLGDDHTATDASVTLSIAGEQPETAATRKPARDAIYWSDFIVDSVEQAVARARVLGTPVSHVTASSLYNESRGEVLVERIDSVDWIVTYHGKRYIVLTDEQGCMLSATLPAHGVTIERRADFSPDRYPLWPPYEAPPDRAYSASEAVIRAPQGHVLRGTLTLPPHPRRVPAAVLITGLGASERNGGAPPWMPLRDLADALTRAGIAVLRVDDRGVGKSTGDHASSTTFDEAADVRTEVGWLRSRPEIDPKRIALIGYSEGGLIAPMVAAADPAIAGIVTLAGPGTTGQQLAREQTEQAVIHNSSIPAADREREIEKQLAEPLTPRESVMLTIDPLEFARQVHCPALIMQGGTDITVPVRSAEKLAHAMRANGNRDVTVRIFPGVSHSLLPDPDGASAGWILLPGFETSPDLLKVMSTWVAGHLSGKTLKRDAGAR